MTIDPGLFQENERTAPNSDGREILRTGPFSCELGGSLPEVQIAFETWGTLNPARDNAVLVCHALSGDSHAIGWWAPLIGEGKALDPREFYIIGVNALGGCQGSTGPGSAHPDGRAYGSRFPEITIGDMVRSQALLLDHLGVERLHLVAGGSMGGMQALEWALRFPGRVANAWITAGAAAHSAMQIGFNEAARQAVLRDPNWQNGDFAPGQEPNHGLAVARMIGHLSFLSESAFEAKFGRKCQAEARAVEGRPKPPLSRSDLFQVESYLNYQGDKFTTRFDARSLVALTNAIDRFDRSDSFSGARSRFLFTSFTSDWLYPTHQGRRMHELAIAAGCESRFEEIDLPYGHDAFLLDGERQGAILGEFLG